MTLGHRDRAAECWEAARIRTSNEYWSEKTAVLWKRDTLTLHMRDDVLLSPCREEFRSIWYTWWRATINSSQYYWSYDWQGKGRSWHIIANALISLLNVTPKPAPGWFDCFAQSTRFSSLPQFALHSRAARRSAIQSPTLMYVRAEECVVTSDCMSSASDANFWSDWARTVNRRL